MESTVRCGNIHTGLRRGQGPKPIASYCASPLPFHVQCDYTITPILINSVELKKSKSKGQQKILNKTGLYVKKVKHIMCCGHFQN